MSTLRNGTDRNDNLRDEGPGETLAGGLGDDIYDVFHAGTTVIELAGGGRDLVVSRVFSITLPDHVEYLSLDFAVRGPVPNPPPRGAYEGIGNGLDNLIAGNSFGNRLSGLGGNDTIDAGLGNDIVLGGLGDDELIGGRGDDRLEGGAGADRLFGGLGRDTLAGEAGDDLLNGGADLDVALYGGLRTDYTLGQATAGQFAVTDRRANGNGADLLTDVELVVIGQELILTRGLQVDALFDEAWYLARNPDVRAAVEAGWITALDHYTAFGWQEGRDPSGWFDASDYLLRNPDVAAAGVDPLLHFVTFGWAEGRVASLADPSYGVLI